MYSAANRLRHPVHLYLSFIPSNQRRHPHRSSSRAVVVTTSPRNSVVSTTTMDEDLPDSIGGGLGVKRQGGNNKYHRTIQSDGTYLTLRHAFGVEGCIRDNVAFVTVPDPDADGGGLMLGYLVHPVGQQVEGGMRVCVALHIGDAYTRFGVSGVKFRREVSAASRLDFFVACMQNTPQILDPVGASA